MYSDWPFEKSIKYIKEFTVTDEPLIKTTTQKIKRHEEMRNLKK